MSKIQWEYDLVEKPFCEQLQDRKKTFAETAKECLVFGFVD
jgi:hypothetical protein